MFLYLFSVTVFIFFRIWIFHSAETRWQKSEACPHSLYSFRQTIAYFINNKSTSGLQNSSDTLFWWFMKNTYWKQSVFIKKGKVGNMFFHSYCCLVYIVCHSFSLVVNLWHCNQMLPGRATTSQMGEEREHTLVFLDLANFLFTLFFSHMIIWTE